MSKPDQPIASLSASSGDTPEQGIDLFGVVVAILSEWRIALITFIVAATLCALYISSLKPMYVAKASFLPQEGRGEGATLASLFSNRGPGELYIGLLGSQTVQNDVIEHANLMTLFHTHSLESTRDILAGITTFADGADTIVTVSVREGNADEAARIANAYLAALKNLNETMGLQQSSLTTSFFQKQLDEEQRQLANAEAVLAQTQTRTGVISEGQTQIALTAIQAVRDQISSIEVKRSALLLSETEQNPEVQRLTQQIGELRGREAQLEGTGKAPVGAATNAGKAPEANLEILRAQREVKYHDVLVTSLANQFEAARLNEAFARSAFQVVDIATAPENKAWPPRKPFFVIAIVFSLFFALVAVVIKLLSRRLLADPEHRAQLQQLRRAFGAR